MGITQSFRLALKSLWGSKMRALLTMLGIIIGVAAVIIIVSLMQGMTGEITGMFESMGTNRLTVNVSGRGTSRSISTDQMFELYEENSDVFLAMSPTARISGTVKANSETLTSSVTGVAEGEYVISGLAMDEGRFISYGDEAARLKVAVVGSYINEEIFNGLALGETIKINGHPFTIVGILAEQDDSTESSADDCVYIPYTTASKIAMVNISSYTYLTHDATLNDAGTEVLEGKLYEVFQNENYYTITDMASIVDSMNEMVGMLTMVLVGIAAVSLLVGGIGIMNIMLVSVTERTREIGIRKALGAKRRHILQQFVIEAATTSGLGGFIGIALGIGVSSLVGGLIGITAATTASAIGLSFGISVAIGIFFGWAPANTASKLNPIDALRYE